MSSHPLSEADREHLLDGIDRLIAGRRDASRLLIEHVIGITPNPALNVPIREVKNAASKVNRYHPDAELLPLGRWSTIEELGILVEHQRRMTPGMSEEGVRAWESAVIRAIREHSAGVVSELERYRAEVEGCAGEDFLRRVGEVWHIGYRGERGEYPAKGNQCVAWLAKLLAAPDRSLTVATLRGDPEGKLAADAMLGSDHEADPDSIKAIKHRLEDIEETTADGGGSAALDEETHQLLDKLIAASRTLNPALKDAHHNVASQLRSFLKKLRGDMPQLSAHLRASLKLDYPTCGYYPPEPRPRWQFRK